MLLLWAMNTPPTLDDVDAALFTTMIFFWGPYLTERWLDAVTALSGEEYFFDGLLVPKNDNR